jgi:hypothetical protein
VSNGRGLGANDFRTAYRKIAGAYRERFEPQIARLRTKYAAPARQNNPMLEEVLEDHIRTYVIDRMLAALRWVIVPSAPDEIENMIPEAQVDPATGARRFMDYLGYEHAVEEPLLVLEAKRPTEFPMGANGSMETASAVMAKWLAQPDTAQASWSEWLPSLKDYVRSVALRTGRFPVRAAITDGDWLVVFERPEDAFADGEQQNPKFIHIFSNSDEIIERYDHVFELLDQREVSRKAGEITPGAIRGAVDADSVVSLMHGLRLLYTTSRTVGHLVPTISVMAAILLRSETGSWTKVTRGIINTDAIRFFPYRNELLADHLEDVRGDAERLLQRVQQTLGRALQPTSLVDHYADGAFDGMHGLEELPGHDGDFWIVTGQATHFLLSAPEELTCPFHDFGNAKKHQCQALEAPLVNPSMKGPRAFFTNGKAHHCCHDDVAGAKHVIIRDENLQRCGPRSGRNKDVFCEIAPVDEFLCCRLCAFQEVCSASDILRLPCDAV